VKFIKELKSMVKHFTNDGNQIILVVGGGKTCRYYQAAAKEFPHVSDRDLDWIGIKTIRLNCELLLRVFSDLDIHGQVIEKWEEIRVVNNKTVIVGAYEPGCSSDKDAIEMARVIGAKRVINFSSTSHVYSADPRIDKNAEKFEELSWADYKNIIPTEWVPGMSAPFDPIAANLAQESAITVTILGASIENLQNYLDGDQFEGTILS
jgi:uridylate kinase